MLGTMMNWQLEGDTYYLKEMGMFSHDKIVWVDYLRLFWRMGAKPLFSTEPFSPNLLVGHLFRLSKALTLLSFVFGVGYGLVKRNWNILALFAFLMGYFLIHIWHGSILPRYCVPVS